MSIYARTAENAEVTALLEDKLRQAARNGFDADRCRAEAEAMVRVIQHRGWRWAEPLMAAPTWRDHKTPVDPTPYAEQAREAIRANRDATNHCLCTVSERCTKCHSQEPA